MKILYMYIHVIRGNANFVTCEFHLHENNFFTTFHGLFEEIKPSTPCIAEWLHDNKYNVSRVLSPMVDGYFFS